MTITSRRSAIWSLRRRRSIGDHGQYQCASLLQAEEKASMDGEERSSIGEADSAPHPKIACKARLVSRCSRCRGVRLELLRPRYGIAAPWPRGAHEVGSCRGRLRTASLERCWLSKMQATVSMPHSIEVGFCNDSNVP